jgi:hypothetical protein
MVTTDAPPVPITAKVSASNMMDRIEQFKSRRRNSKKARSRYEGTIQCPNLTDIRRRLLLIAFAPLLSCAASE